MSSAILYLAIVAIWAFCLVPRWVRRAHSAPAAAGLAEAPPEPGSAPAESGAAGPSAGAGPEVLMAEAPAAPESTALRNGTGTAGGAAGGLAESGVGEELSVGPVPSAPPPVSRPRMLQARRRLLAGLIVLTAVGAVGTTAKLAAWWLFIPPAGLLGLYLLLLREVALADAERARWRAEQAAIRDSAARERVHADRADRADRAARTVIQPQPTAKVIDISARVGGDQFYDQYADSAARAAGD